MLTLQIKTDKPFGGYWDGGPKDTFDLTLGRIQEDAKGKFQKIDCYDANYWFHVSKGKTDKITLINGLNHIRHMFKRENIGFTYSFITE
jgi:hypothetical protein